MFLNVSQTSQESTCVAVFFFKKNVQAQGLQLYFKKASKQVFSCEVYETFKNNFFLNRTPVTASAPPVAASGFF